MLLRDKIIDSLPDKPYCTDQLGYMQILPKLQAMQKSYLQYNHNNLSTLVYDLDYAVNPYDLAEGNTAPAPNIIAQNRENGHAHVFYCLDKPVYMASFDQKKNTAFRYAGYVDKKMTIGLEADPGYGKLLAKSIYRDDRWKILDIHGQQYLLGDLDLDVKIDRRERLDYGYGRNVTLFETVRRRAYRLVRQSWFNYEIYEQIVWAEANQVNHTFPKPLRENEVGHIVKSIAQWTWTRMSPVGFTQWAENRRKKSQRVRSAKSQKRAQQARFLRDKGLNQSQIAKELGLNQSQVSRLLGT